MNPALETTETIELAPNYRIAIAVVAIGVGVTVLNLWVGAVVALFGVFLFVQTVLLRLRFTAQSLEVYRGETMIRSFPYTEWSHWEIFWKPIPILFYFREINSIHFLPILFDPATLEQCLIQRCPQIES